MRQLGFLDTETVSDLDIKAAGTIRYAEMCDPLSVHVVPVQSHQVRRYEAHLGPVPVWLDEALLDAGTTWVAHNAMFDRWVVVEGLGYYNLADPARWVCTAALARYAGLPGRLKQLCDRLGLAEGKDDYGETEGINTFTKRYSRAFRTPAQEPEKWRRFMGYGDQDTRVLPEVYRRLGHVLRGRAAEHWKRHESKVYLWDQRVNDLGIPVDPDVLGSALAMVGLCKPRMEREMSELTGGEITKLGSPKLKDYVNSEFLMALPNLRADETLRPALESGELDPRCEDILRLRLNGFKSSLAKYGRMEAMMSRDRRVRAGFLYHGAHTGRWAGQGFQPQNLTRPGEGLDPVEVADAIAECRGNPDALAERFDAPIYDILTAGIRGSIKAGPGKVLVIADYNQIESRLLAWGSGCARKMQAFADHDAGVSELDPYEVTALDVLGDANRRQEGKVMDLGLGFGMGDTKFSRITGTPYPRAKRMVAGWRDAYHEVPTYWYELQLAFSEAIKRGSSNRYPVERDPETKLGVMWLPSGKPLFYHTLRNASWGETLVQAACYGKYDDAVARMHRCGLSEKNPHHLRHANVLQLAFRGQYGNIRLVHGGFLVENWDQGTAREVMCQHALEIEAETGRIPVLHAHDELVFEVAEREAEAFARYVEDKMGDTPIWALGLALKAEVKLSPRYTK